MKKTIKAWAVFNKDGAIVMPGISLKSAGWAKSDLVQSINRDKGYTNWGWLKEIGYRVRRITITVED